MINYAEAAYNAYKEAVGGISPVTGDSLPEYRDLPDEVKQGWRAAAERIIELRG